MNLNNGLLSGVVCTKCGSDSIYIEKPPLEEKVGKKTLDDFVNDIYAPVPAVYIMTTYACKECGYSVSR